jgi:acyl-CoA thioester hydrolase
MSKVFSVRVAVRGYEVDYNGHAAGTVLLQYGQHARFECLRAAGVDQSDLLASGVSPVSLEERIRFHREVRAGEEIDVSCSYIWGDGKTFRVEQELRHADGALVAEITNVGGLLDLKQRRLVPKPGEHWRAVAGKADVLGL